MKEFFFQSDVLKVIGGTTGLADGKKVLQAIVQSVIAPEFLSTISWTGRAASGKSKKIALETYKNVKMLFSDVAILADKKLTIEMVEHILKYKIIKYAYLNSKQR